MVTVAMTACAKDQDPPANDPSQAPRGSTGLNIDLTLYFADADANDLVEETRTVNRVDEDMADLVLRELIAGPDQQGLIWTVPAETTVLSTRQVGNVLEVDFSKDIIEKHPGGSAAEVLTIKSIVYSLTEIEGIDKVQLLVEGEKHDALFGNAYTEEPIGR